MSARFLPLLILPVLCSINSLGAEFTESEVNRVIDQCIHERNILAVTRWADSDDDHRDSGRWDEMLPRLITNDSTRNNILFALYARCCLFAPRDVVRLFGSDYRSPFGDIDLGARTRFVVDLPVNIARRYMHSGKSVVVSASLAKIGRGSGPAVVYIGINKPDWKPGDPIKLEDIDFVNTEFDWVFLDSKPNARRPEEAAGETSPSDSRRSAPPQPRDDPPPAKPGSAIK